MNNLVDGSIKKSEKKPINFYLTKGSWKDNQACKLSKFLPEFYSFY